MHCDTRSPDCCRPEGRFENLSPDAFRLLAKRRPLTVLAEQLDILRVHEPLGADSQRAAYAFADRLDPKSLAELGPKDVGEVVRGALGLRWSAQVYNSPRSTQQWTKARDLLTDLFDENVPIEDRLETLWPATAHAPLAVLTPAYVTPLLHIRRPSHYPVWSPEVQRALKLLSLWPRPAASGGQAGEYAALMSASRELSRMLRTDLWSLESALMRLADIDDMARSFRADGW